MSTTSSLPHWVSMTRVGAEFGWTVRKTSQVFKELGLRNEEGFPSELGLTMAKRFSLPMTPDFFRWELSSSVEFLKQAGYEHLQPLERCAAALERVSKLSYDVQNRYYSRTDTRRNAILRRDIEAKRAQAALLKFSQNDRARLLSNLHAKMSADGWSRSDTKEVFSALNVSQLDLAAAILEASTPVVASPRPRRGL